MLLAGALLLLAAGCGGTPPAERSEGAHATGRAAPLGPHGRRPPPAPAVCGPGPVALGSVRVAYAALLADAAVARRRPGGPAVARLGRLDENRLPTVLGVLGLKRRRDCRPAWYEVELPVLRNGTTGWVPARAVRLFSVGVRIVVSLSERRLSLYRAGRLVLRAPAGVGAPATPTPVGRYVVDERWVLTSPDGPFGPAALGISAHSEALAAVWVEHGPIAIHGTNEPWTVGQAASHGCIRLANAVMRRLFPLVPAGTPVIIRP